MKSGGPTSGSLRTFVVVCTLLAACGRSDGPAQVDGPAQIDEPPWGLDRVVLPEDETSIDAVLRALPDEVGGYARQPPQVPLGVAYGPPDGGAIVVAQEVTAAPGVAPGTWSTVGEFLTSPGRTDDVQLESQGLDPQGAVMWIVATTPPEVGPLPYGVFWGSPDSAWLFYLAADSPDVRRELAQAVVRAIRSPGLGSRG